MSYRILIRGADTDLAVSFLGVMEDYPFVLLTPSSQSLDWADHIAVASYFAEKSPNLVINFPCQYCLACEADVEAAASLAMACEANSLPLIQLSSFLAFGLEYHEEGVKESDQPSPEDPVGRQIFAMEKAALSCGTVVVLRLPWLMDMVAESLFDRIIPLLMAGKLPPVSDHHRFHLVSSGYVLRCLIALIHQVFCGAENWGVFHLRSSDMSSEAEFIDVTLRMLQVEADMSLSMPVVLPGRDDGCLLPGSANLLGRRCTDEFGIQFPSWRHGFKSLLKRWLHVNNLVEDRRKIQR